MPDVQHGSPREDEAQVPVPMPPLVVILTALERQKGSELSEAEVLAARDKAVCMRVPLSIARRLEEARGYKDIELTDTWTAWRRFSEPKAS